MLLLRVLALLALLSGAAHAQFLSKGCNTTTVVTGGTAVVAITGPYNGFQIVNPTTATDQGIGTSESLYVDTTTTTSTTTGNGTNQPLTPGQPLGWSGYSANPNGVSVNAATSGHKFVCYRW